MDQPFKYVSEHNIISHAIENKMHEQQHEIRNTQNALILRMNFTKPSRMWIIHTCIYHMGRLNLIA